MVIAEREGDDGASIGQQVARIRPALHSFLRKPGKAVHEALGYASFCRLATIGKRIGGRHADNIKAELRGGVLDGLRYVGGIVASTVH